MGQAKKRYYDEGDDDSVYSEIEREGLEEAKNQLDSWIKESGYTQACYFDGDYILAEDEHDVLSNFLKEYPSFEEFHAELFSIILDSGPLSNYHHHIDLEINDIHRLEKEINGFLKEDVRWLRSPLAKEMYNLLSNAPKISINEEEWVRSRKGKYQKISDLIPESPFPSTQKGRGNLEGDPGPIYLANEESTSITECMQNKKGDVSTIKVKVNLKNVIDLSGSTNDESMLDIADCKIRKSRYLLSLAFHREDQELSRRITDIVFLIGAQGIVWNSIACNSNPLAKCLLIFPDFLEKLAPCNRIQLFQRDDYSG